MTDDWQKLGDVVARIVARTEVKSGPPIPTEEAVLFVALLTEIYGPPPEHVAALCEPEPQRKGSR